MKPTNVRELMNLLSQKYFGNDHTYTSVKPQISTKNNHFINQESTYTIMSPVISCKTSPKFNRISSSQSKSKQNLNHLEQTKNYFEETRAKLKKPIENVFKNNERKRLELRDFNGLGAVPYACDSSSEMQQSESQVTQNLYNRKSSDKDLMRNISGSYLTNPATFSNIASFEHGKQNNKNIESRFIKESITESKGVAKKLILTESSSSVHKLESNSTISHSRSSLHTKKQSDDRDLLVKKKEQYQKMKEELEFYKRKCLNLEQENTQLKEKVSTYEEQFAEEKLLVENLKTMISRREEEIDEIIQKRLAGFEKKEQMLELLQVENETLRNELQEVREVLRQQETIIMELYAQHKQKSTVLAEQKPRSISKSVSNSNTQPTANKMVVSNFMSKNMCSPASPNQINSLNRPYVSSYLNNGRQSIAETSYEEDQYRMDG